MLHALSLAAANNVVNIPCPGIIASASKLPWVTTEAAAHRHLEIMARARHPHVGTREKGDSQLQHCFAADAVSDVLGLCMFMYKCP